MQQDLHPRGPDSAEADTGGERLRAAADVYETAAAWHLVVALPGVRQEDLRVDLEGDKLRVSGRRAAFAPEGLSRLQGHVPAGVLERTFFLPEGVRAEHVEAQFEQGLLRVTLARPAPQRRSIPVRAS